MFTYDTVIRGRLRSLCKELSGFGLGFFGCMVGCVMQRFEILMEVFKDQLHPLLKSVKKKHYKKIKTASLLHT